MHEAEVWKDLWQEVDWDDSRISFLVGVHWLEEENEGWKFRNQKNGRKERRIYTEIPCDVPLQDIFRTVDRKFFHSRAFHGDIFYRKRKGYRKVKPSRIVNMREGRSNQSDFDK